MPLRQDMNEMPGGGEIPDQEVRQDRKPAAVACLLREIGRRTTPGADIQIACEGRSKEGSIFLDCRGLDLNAAVLENLRDPLDASDVLTRGHEGAGLGIAVAERIVRLHSGRLWIGASGEGGLRVTLSLPLRESPSQMPGNANALVDEGSGGKAQPDRS